MCLKRAIHRRLCVPATPSEIAAIFRAPLHTIRAHLYALKRQGKAERLLKRVPKSSARGRQWEYLWIARL